MRIATTFATQFGRRLAGEPAPQCLRSPADRADLARRLDRRADIAMAEGDGRLADILAWRAAGLREVTQ